MSDDKECFFIAPIGEEGSETRKRSDNIMEYIVDEAVSDFGYSVKRADQMDQPGSITSQVIQKTVNSELVIADLTEHNPNVFYELAVRHATGEPYIQLIQSTESIPFDISDIRTIKYGLGVEEADRAREKIRAQLMSLRDEDPEFDNPISRSAEMESLRESGDPTDHNFAEILTSMANLERKVDRLENNMINHGSKNSDGERPRTLVIDDYVFEIDEESVSRSTIETISDNTDKTPREVENILKQNGFSIYV